MSLERYAFLIKADGYPSDGFEISLPSSLFTTRLFASSDLASLIMAAQRFADDGVQVVEICGGFDDDDFELLQTALNGRIPIGRVTFDHRNQMLLNQCLS